MFGLINSGIIVKIGSREVAARDVPGTVDKFPVNFARHHCCRLGNVIDDSGLILAKEQEVLGGLVEPNWHRFSLCSNGWTLGV